MNLFVPSRLCLLDEHADWGKKYRSMNENRARCFDSDGQDVGAPGYGVYLRLA